MWARRPQHREGKGNPAAGSPGSHTERNQQERGAVLGCAGEGLGLAPKAAC